MKNKYCFYFLHLEPVKPEHNVVSVGKSAQIFLKEILLVQSNFRNLQAAHQLSLKLQRYKIF